MKQLLLKLSPQPVVQRQYLWAHKLELDEEYAPSRCDFGLLVFKQPPPNGFSEYLLAVSQFYAKSHSLTEPPFFEVQSMTFKCPLQFSPICFNEFATREVPWGASEATSIEIGTPDDHCRGLHWILLDEGLVEEEEDLEDDLLPRLIYHQFQKTAINLIPYSHLAEVKEASLVLTHVRDDSGIIQISCAWMMILKDYNGTVRTPPLPLELLTSS